MRSTIAAAAPAIVGALCVAAMVAALALAGGSSSSGGRSSTPEVAPSVGMLQTRAPSAKGLARERLDAYAIRVRTPLATSLSIPKRTTRLLRQGHGPRVVRGLHAEQRRALAAARAARVAAPTDDPQLRRTALLLERSLLLQASMLGSARSALRDGDRTAARRSRAQAHAAGTSLKAWHRQVTELARSRGSAAPPIGTDLRPQDP